MLGNTNNKTVDAPFPDHVSYLWGDSQRVQRMAELMRRREVHTRESLVEAQLDAVSVSARALLPLAGRDLWFTAEAAPEGTPERRRATALGLLAAWNGEMSEHLPEPLIYAAWMRALQDRLLRDELGPLAADYARLRPLFLERVLRDVDGAGAWCDVVRSTPVETCSDAARLALDDALQALAERYGASIEGWRWGDAHEARHDHPVLGDVPFLGALVNIRQSSSGGDNTPPARAHGRRGGGALRERPRCRLSRGLRLRRPREQRLRHRHRPVRPPPVAALRRPGRALATGRVRADDARPRAGAGGARSA